MDEDTAQDYLTGEDAEDEVEEIHPVVPERQLPAARNSSQRPQADQTTDLVARVAELEQMLREANQRKSAAVPTTSGATAKAPPLFQNSANRGELKGEDWAKLQQLAGSAPSRIARAEAQRPQGQTTAEEFRLQLFADMEKEAVDPNEAMGALTGMEEPIQDPVHRLMMLQLKQNQQLLEKLCAPKHRDPVLGALAGGGSGNESASSSGVTKVVWLGMLF